jgi:DNA polymerase-3 subunit gamma/tau
MGQALYRKYRSKSLDEIVGQSHITDLLQRAISADKVAHAYLLTGPRGVGKTSIARILAHEINKLPYTDESIHLDIVEIDAASNNGVDDIRDLRDKVQIAPTSARKKIYIIDEVHMLSKQAFNALLKTLEEPPEHVVFILATTDVDKLPPTIISRVQRFNFRAITEQDAARHLRTIADAEHIAISDESLALIAHHGRGSFRDSISLLDQLQNISDDTISPDLIERVLGLADTDTVERILDAYQANDLATLVQLIDDNEQRGTPAATLAEQLIRTIRTRIATEPQLLPLLDRLLEIPRSAWPHIKLLTALGSRMSTPPPTAAQPASKPVAAPKPPVVKPAKAAQAAPAVPPVPTPVAPIQEEAEFPWQDFLIALKADSMGASTMLSKCGYHYSPGHLVIYAGKPFAKKQLEKSMSSIASCLQQLGVNDTEVMVLAEPKPASDSTTAAVLDIMGGGEEVSL